MVPGRSRRPLNFPIAEAVRADEEKKPTSKLAGRTSQRGILYQSNGGNACGTVGLIHRWVTTSQRLRAKGGLLIFKQCEGKLQ